MQLPRNEYRISITSSCNMKCVYCHNEGNRYSINLDKASIEKLIQNSYGLGLKEVRLTGGEPTIHYQFLDICQMLKEVYNLKVGVNSNGIEKDRLLYAIRKGWIDRITIGIDYIDGNISKQSPCGKSSEEILNNVLEFKNNNCDVNLATVFTGDFENTKKIASWGIDNKIRVKILEVVKNEICNTTSIEYQKMCEEILRDFKLIKDYDEFKQIRGLENTRRIAISFFHSHCRLRECDICKDISLRVTAKGKLKRCLHYDDDDICYMSGNVHDNVITMLDKPINYYRDENNHPIERKR